KSLSFRPIKEEVHNKLLDLFKNGHLSSSALYALEDDFHLSAKDKQELVELLADQATNPNYDSVYHIFWQYCNAILGGRNGKSMFEQLELMDLLFYTSLRPRPFLQDQNFITVNDTSNNDFDKATEQ
ncbi:2620_t:CDS:2, partial [Dentiscutata erythropus]